MTTKVGGYCFIPDNETVFKLVKVIERNDGDKTLTVVDYERQNGPSTRVKEETTVAVGSLEELENPPSDLIKLQYVHRPGILHTLRSRFYHDQIYTSIGQILVALNPFKWIPGIYDQSMMLQYKNKKYNLSDQPHVFAISHDSFSDLAYGQNMSLIISGESGAGKTEATKQCLNYLAFIAGSSSGIQGKILKASPILEAWGNAKTLRNNNSSRFGKYIEIWFDKHHSIIGSSNTTYILEKSRVVRQESGERNYHVFYQLLKGATPQQLLDFHLISSLDDSRVNLESFHYINQSGCIEIEDVDDKRDFKEANEAFEEIGFSSEEQWSLYRIIAGILHLGNIKFTGSSEESSIDPPSEAHFQYCANMFQVDAEEFKRSLLFRKITSGGKRKSVVFAPYAPAAAMDNRDALAKEIYRRCFDWIVAKINFLMYSDHVVAQQMIGVLDIFGFEIFKKNSFEQLCINLANEALQQHFNSNIFQAEMDTYMAEDVPVPKLDYKDNQDVLDLIVKKPKGLIPMLDEEGIVPRGSWEGFYSKFSKQNAGNPRMKIKQKTNELGIVHYAGEVYYDPSLFLVKNKDTLSQDLIDALAVSKDRFVTSLFDEAQIQERESSIGSFRSHLQQQGGKVEETTSSGSAKRVTSDSKMTVGRKFSIQLESLITNLNSTKPRYIRCIKPNQVKKPNIFVHDLTNEQLTYSGVFEAVIIMQSGYPFRLPHMQFRQRYYMLVTNSAYRRLVFDINAFQAYVKKVQSVEINDAAVQEIVKQAIANDTKGIKQHYGTITRQQCSFMMNCIQRCHANDTNKNHKIDTTKCFIGRTKIFYQANEHRALDELRDIIMERAVILIQRQMRRHTAQKLVKEILKEEAVCIQAIKSRRLDILQNSSAILGQLQVRVIKGCALEGLDIKIVYITNEYCLAVEKEKYCVDQILSTDKESLDEESKLEQLSTLINSAKSINFNASHKGISLHLVWSENPILRTYEEKVKIMSNQIKIKKQLAEGIASKNEFMLEEAVKALNELKKSVAKVKTVSTQLMTAYKKSNAENSNAEPLPSIDLDLPKDYCIDTEAIARKIIEDAAREYEASLQAIHQAIIQGSFRSMKGKDNEMIAEVDPVSLESVIAKYSVKEEGKKKPVKLELLLVTCKNLVKLRQLAKQGKWEELWVVTQQEWSKVINISQSKSPQQSNDADAKLSDENYVNKVMSGELMFLPGELERLVSDEVGAMSSSAINSFILPRFEGLLNNSPIPEELYYLTAIPKTVLDVAPLECQLAATQVYEQYFDEGMKKFLFRMKEHLMFRQSLLSGRKEIILSQVQNLQYIPKTHQDYVVAQNYKNMYESITNVFQAIREEAWHGEVGNFQPIDVQYSKLHSNLDVCRGLIVKEDIGGGKSWAEILLWSAHLVAMRRYMKDEKYEQAEKHVKKVLESPEFKAFEQRVQEQSNEFQVDFLESARIIVKELNAYMVESRHVRAMKVIMTSFKRGNIPTSIEEGIFMDILLPETEQFFVEFQKVQSLLIENAYFNQMMKEIYLVIDFRKLVIQEDWEPLKARLLPYRDETQGFQRCLPLCQEEFQSIYQRIMDYDCRTRLAESLSAIEVPEEVTNNCKLLDIIKQFQGDSVLLSIQTRKTLNIARALFLLRCALRDHHFEPEGFISFGFQPTEKLLALLTGEKEATNNSTSSITKQQDVKVIERTMQQLRGLEATMASHMQEIGKKVERLDTANTTVVELYSWIRSHEDQVPNTCRAEIESAIKLSLDRRCVAMLLLAVSTGKCQGTIERLNFRTVKTDSLRSALVFCEENRLHWSEMTTSWIEMTRTLMDVREKVLKLYNTTRLSNDSNQLMMGSSSPSSSAVGTPEKPSTNNQPSFELNHVIDGEKLQRMIQSNKSGFPIQELNLIVNKINDLNTFEEFLKAVSFGAPSFSNGKFDVSRVQFAHLLERLETAKKLPVRSDRLDRLFFYLELLINLRLAVTANQWELSERGEQRSRTTLDRKIVTVKRCLTEYTQAEKFFRTAIPGVPPQCIVNEFKLVEREWERRLILQSFTGAYRTGTIVGSPFSLMFHEVRIEKLSLAIKHVQKVEAESNEIDNDVQIFVKAANELIHIRQEALNVQQQYASSKPQFAQPTNHIQSILDELSFLPSAIKRAVDTVDDIKEGYFLPFSLNNQAIVPAGMTSSGSAALNKRGIRQSVNMDHLVESMTFSLQLPFSLPEVILIQSDWFERLFVSDVLHYCRTTMTIISLPNDQILRIQEELIRAVQIFEQRHSQAQGSATANKSSSSSALINSSSASERSLKEIWRPKPINHSISKVAEFVWNSAIILIHLFRAKIQNIYDSYDRDWKVDINLANTPRMQSLSHNLITGKYSMQQIIRASKRYDVHGNITVLLDSFEKEIEDKVSELELKQALTDPQYASYGSIGSVEIPDIAIEYAASVLQRIEKVGYQNTAIRSQRNILETIHSLRVRIKEKSFSDGLQIIGKYLRLSSKSLEFIASVLYESEDTVAISPIARKEFFLLSKEICDNVWKVDAKRVLMEGRIHGSRGAISSHRVDYRSLMLLSKCLPIMKEKSDELMLLDEICGYVKTMRYALLASAETNFFQNYRDDSGFVSSSSSQSRSYTILQDSSSGAEPVAAKTRGRTQTLTGLATLDDGSNLPSNEEIGKFMSSSIENSIYNISLITHSNHHWLKDNSSPIDTIEQMRAKINDTIEMESEYFETESALREALQEECNLLNQHINFMQASYNLANYLNAEYISFSPQGLQLTQDYRDLMMIVEQYKQEHFSVSLVHEFWCGQLLTLGELLINLLKQLSMLIDGVSMGGISSSSGRRGGGNNPFLSQGSALYGNVTRSLSQSFALILPGTKDFQTLIKPIASYLQAVDHMQRTFERKPGSQKGSFPFPLLLQAHNALKQSIQEHASVKMLHSIIKSEDIFFFEDDDGTLIFHNFSCAKLRMIKESDLLEEGKVTYDAYATALLAAIDELPVSTMKGTTLKDSAKLLVKFRAEIKSKAWFKAQVVGQQLVAVPEFSYYANEKETLAKYTRVIQVQRTFEYNIYRCLLPEIANWSLCYNISIALDSVGLHLNKFLRKIVDGSSGPLPKYKLFSELTEVAYRTVEVIDSIKGKLWISASDLTEYPDHPDILSCSYAAAEDIIVHDMIYLPPASTDSLTTTSPNVTSSISPIVLSSVSVLSCLTNLKQTLTDSRAVPQYLKQHIKLEIKKIETELIAVQLDHLIKYTLDHVQFVNLPGELLISDCQEMLVLLCSTLESYPNHLHSCKKLKQGWLTAKLILSILSANRDGQIKQLGQSMDMIAYFLERKEESITVIMNKSDESSTNSGSSNTGSFFINDQEKLFVMDEFDYQQLFLKNSKLHFTSQVMTVPRFSPIFNVQDSHHADNSQEENKHDLVRLLNPKHVIKDEFALELQVRELFQSLNNNKELEYSIREEFSSYLTLLFQHYLFEMLYQSFEEALLHTPAKGLPGEIETSQIEYEKFNEILNTLNASKIELRGYVSLLYYACEALHTIRQGQKNQDYGMIMEGCNLARIALSKENDYEPQRDIQHFGGRRKKFLKQVVKEIDLAEEDMKQINLITQLQKGLATKGVSHDRDYPYDSSLEKIELSYLSEAYEANMNVIPASRLAQDLLTSTKVILQVRRLTMEKKWNEVIELVSLHGVVSMDSFDLPFNSNELYAALMIASVSLAIETSQKAFQEGRIVGNVDQLDSIELVDVETVLQAKKYFEQVREEWKNDEVHLYESTCEIIYEIRYYLIHQDYGQLLGSSEVILDQIKKQERLILPSCQDEVELAYKFSACTLIKETFGDSLSHGGLRGKCGRLDSSELYLHGLKNAYLMSKAVGLQHPTIEKLESSGEIIYRLRHAQARNAWIYEDQLQIATNKDSALDVNAPDDSSATSTTGNLSPWSPYRSVLRDYVKDTSIPGYGSTNRSRNKRLSKSKIPSDFSLSYSEDGNYNNSSTYSVFPSLKPEGADGSNETKEISEEILDNERTEGDEGFSLRAAFKRDTARSSNNIIPFSGPVVDDNVDLEENDKIDSAKESSTKKGLTSVLFATVSGAEGEEKGEHITDDNGIEYDEYGVPTVGDIDDYDIDADETDPMEVVAEEEDDTAGWEAMYFATNYHPDETVEDLLSFYDSIRSNVSLYDPMTFAELELAYQEMRFRQVLLRLMKAVYSSGYQGYPGDVRGTVLPSTPSSPTAATKTDGSSGSSSKEIIETDILEAALQFAQQYAEIAQLPICQRFMRDTKFLLDARKARIANNFVELEQVIQRVEDHTASVLEYREHNLVEDEADEDKKADMLELMQPILPKVWEEIKLLKYDSLFQIALFEFVQELKRDEDLGGKILSHGSDAAGLSSLSTKRASFVLPPPIDYDQRIYQLQVIYDFLKNASRGYPCNEFERLIEAIGLGIKLRKFVRDSPTKSPQHIIDQVAKAKTRDKRKGVTCYASLLIFEISKMSNVLDFPTLLEKIGEEIIHGRKYLERPIGKINYEEIRIDSMNAAYQAALPSLEIMGTDENHAFMKMAYAIMQIRRHLQQGDLSSAMKVAIDHEQSLSKFQDLVSEEIKRLRIEMENVDAGKLLQYGLKTGRYLDVIIIAKLKSSYEHYESQKKNGNSTVDANNSPTEAELDGSGHGELGNAAAGRLGAVASQSVSTKRRSSVRASRRVSQGIADMMYHFEKMYLEVESNGGTSEDNAAVISAVTAARSNNASSAPMVGGLGAVGQSRMSTRHTSIFQLGNNDIEASHNWYISPKFIDTVKSSIYALKRAVSVTSRVSQKSHITEHYLNAAKTILQLRESIITNQWQKVQEIVSQSLYLPEVALEEVNAIREGLLFQKCVEIVSSAVLQGGIKGAINDLQLDQLEFQHIEDVVDALEAGSFQDRAAIEVIQFARQVIAVRKGFLRYAAQDRLLSKGMDLSHKFRPDETENVFLKHSRRTSSSSNAATATNSSEASDMTLSITNPTSNTFGSSMGGVENENLNLFTILEEFENFQCHDLFTLLRNLGMFDELKLRSLIQDDSPSNSVIIMDVDQVFSSHTIVLSEFFWMNQLIESIYQMKAEVEFITEVVKYRDVTNRLITAINALPLPLLHYIEYHDRQKVVPAIVDFDLELLIKTKLNVTANNVVSAASSSSSLHSSRMLGSNNSTLSLPYKYCSRTDVLLHDLVMINSENPLSESKGLTSSLTKMVLQKDRYFIKFLENAIIETESYLRAHSHLFYDPIAEENRLREAAEEEEQRKKNSESTKNERLSISMLSSPNLLSSNSKRRKDKVQESAEKEKTNSTSKSSSKPPMKTLLQSFELLSLIETAKNILHIRRIVACAPPSIGGSANSGLDLMSMDTSAILQMFQVSPLLSARKWYADFKELRSEGGFPNGVGLLETTVYDNLIKDWSSLYQELYTLLENTTVIRPFQATSLQEQMQFYKQSKSAATDNIGSLQESVGMNSISAPPEFLAIERLILKGKEFLSESANLMVGLLPFLLQVEAILTLRRQLFYGNWIEISRLLKQYEMYFTIVPPSSTDPNGAATNDSIFNPCGSTGGGVMKHDLLYREWQFIRECTRLREFTRKLQVFLREINNDNLKNYQSLSITKNAPPGHGLDDGTAGLVDNDSSISSDPLHVPLSRNSLVYQEFVQIKKLFSAYEDVCERILTSREFAARPMASRLTTPKHANAAVFVPTIDAFKPSPSIGTSAGMIPIDELDPRALCLVGVGLLKLLQAMATSEWISTNTLGLPPESLNSSVNATPSKVISPTSSSDDGLQSLPVLTKDMFFRDYFRLGENQEEDDVAVINNTVVNDALLEEERLQLEDDDDELPGLEITIEDFTSKYRLNNKGPLTLASLTTAPLSISSAMEDPDRWYAWKAIASVIKGAQRESLPVLHSSTTARRLSAPPSGTSTAPSFYLSSSPSVCDILRTTNWSKFPINIQKVFNIARNKVIELDLRKDLLYYIKKGGAHLDTYGNIVVSELYLRYLKASLNDVDRVIFLSNRYGIHFQWSADTSRHIEIAKLLLALRSSLVSNNIIELKSIMQAHNLWIDQSPMHERDELSVGGEVHGHGTPVSQGSRSPPASVDGGQGYGGGTIPRAASHHHANGNRLINSFAQGDMKLLVEFDDEIRAYQAFLAGVHCEEMLRSSIERLLTFPLDIPLSKLYQSTPMLQLRALVTDNKLQSIRSRHHSMMLRLIEKYVDYIHIGLVTGPGQAMQSKLDLLHDALFDTSYDFPLKKWLASTFFEFHHLIRKTTLVQWSSEQAIMSATSPQKPMSSPTSVPSNTSPTATFTSPTKSFFGDPSESEKKEATLTWTGTTANDFDRIVSHMVDCLCTIIYFMAEKHVKEICKGEDEGPLLRSLVRFLPTQRQEKCFPFEFYRRFHRIYSDLPMEFMIYRPHWTIFAMIILFYMKTVMIDLPEFEQMKITKTGIDAQGNSIAGKKRVQFEAELLCALLDVHPDLIAFLREIDVGQFVVFNSKQAEVTKQLTQPSSSPPKNESPLRKRSAVSLNSPTKRAKEKQKNIAENPLQGIHSSAYALGKEERFYPRNSPNALVLMKFITLIHNQEVKQRPNTSSSAVSPTRLPYVFSSPKPASRALSSSESKSKGERESRPFTFAKKLSSFSVEELNANLPTKAPPLRRSVSVDPALEEDIIPPMRWLEQELHHLSRVIELAESTAFPIGLHQRSKNLSESFLKAFYGNVPKAELNFDIKLPSATSNEINEESDVDSFHA